MIEVRVADPEVRRLISTHDLSDPARVHDDLVAASCCRVPVGAVVRRAPNTTGDVCANCGGMAVRTGSCTTCTECATTGGCG